VYPIKSFIQEGLADKSKESGPEKGYNGVSLIGEVC
jgi:hypothetical protein